MILDLDRKGQKEMFITDQVLFIKQHREGYWTVRFKTSPRIFNYNQDRIRVLKNPEVIDLEKRGLYIGYKHITNALSLLRFRSGREVYYRVAYDDNHIECLEGETVYVTRTPMNESGGSVWDYLNKLAEETGLLTECEDNILSMQYKLIDLKRDNVPLAQYMGDKTKLRTYQMPKMIYYPFGCNISQKEAIEAALTHQVSIIQGPPGTGKTQTILNIIANLLYAHKTVLVVSNNNSAVENVEEKLKKEGLGFLVAQLGSVENRTNFINSQSDNYPHISNWLRKNQSQLKKRAKISLSQVSEGFMKQSKEALLRTEYDVLTIEKRYHDLLNQEEQKSLKWLYQNSSTKIMKVLTQCQMRIDKGKKLDIFFRSRSTLRLGLGAWGLLKKEPAEIHFLLEKAYYHVRKSEIESELESIAQSLKDIDLKRSIKELRDSSLEIIKSKIAQRYCGRPRPLFTLKDLKPRTEEFLEEYPIVLSTTYSAKNCISKDMVFDYVIMDEASQVDIKTGALALSCAANAVIVGDDKQLPNVVSREEALALSIVQAQHSVPDCYNAVTHSFLQSCAEIFKQAPMTLLREHYRCHPKIIGFCNQRFYDGELIPMTSDLGEMNALQVVRTVKGNHARNHFNQREIDVIVHEVIPQYANQGSIGIITPYRKQAEALNQALGRDIASTVHKYQGRECDTIIMTTVDNEPTEFSDDPNLLNVAISRAKTNFCIVTTGNDIPENTNLFQLISYIQYNNFEVKQSELHSVFDLLYRQYTAERLAYQKSQRGVSTHLSENLIYDVITKALKRLGTSNLSVLCHYPLHKLIRDYQKLSERERKFVQSPYAHVDFLLYNTLTKSALLTFEVDGWSYHKGREVQQARDALKDQILDKYNLTPIRISTTDTVTEDSIKDTIEHALQNLSHKDKEVKNIYRE